ncbi:MAG TPA: ABC transporter permease [Acidimicrobiales bacterium]|nr:ABC transporter permease [Acidimicrobiales bacterium]
MTDVLTATDLVLGEAVADRGRPSPRRGRARRRSATVLVAQVVVLGVLFGSWQALAATKVLDPNFVSEPSQFFPAFWHGVDGGSLLSLVGTTLYETAVGFVIATVLGLFAGYLLAEFKAIDAVFRPFLTGFNSIPRIALAPLFVLWFGLGSLSRIVLIVSLGFFIVAFNTYAGLQGVNRDHLLLARALGARRAERFFKFVLPSAAPSIFAGIQLALTYAFLGAVVGEMLTGSAGLGGYLALKMGTFDTTDFFGGLLLLIVVALVVSAAFRALETRLLRWKIIELRGTRG